MAKGTLIFLLCLTILATLLFGINLGKKLGISQNNLQPTTYNLQPSTPPSPTITITTRSSSPSGSLKKTQAVTTYTDNTCGFSFSYPGSYMKQKSVNGQASILTDPDDQNTTLAATCAKSIPRPPVSSDKIESIMLDKAAATLYHDQNQDGTPRDEVIVKHPVNGMEIIFTGYGDTFQNSLTSFKFTK